MNLPTLIEKLIEFLRDKISVLEKENGLLKSENAILKGKENAIESQLNKATKEIERLNQVIKGPKKDGEKPRLDAVTEKVLKLFFDAGRELSINDIAASLSINISIAQYHFDLLLEDDLIIQTRVGFVAVGRERPSTYNLTSSGRKYVMEKILA